ncbi:MAG: Hcp family type VI secretion system effector [Candidatus Hodarchaeales archaeon]|jgi:type VI secretion system secreted protein Hcp
MQKRTNRRLFVFLTLFVGIVSISIISIINNQFVIASPNEIDTEIVSLTTMNLFIEGIDGESTISGRENSIVVIGFSHSISNPYELATGKTTTKQHSPLRVMKEVDKASPKLFEKCVKGAVLTSVILKFYHEPNGLKFYTIELQNAYITSVQGYGTLNPDNLPMETISFTYEKIKWIYTEFDDMGNSKGNVEAEDTWINPPS